MNDRHGGRDIINIVSFFSFSHPAAYALKGGLTMKNLYIDVMVQGGLKFYCSLIYTYNPLFKLDLDDVARFVNKKRPTLKYQKDVVLMIDSKAYDKRRGI